jgi:PAS domain S-box-containing protein
VPAGPANQPRSLGGAPQQSLARTFARRLGTYMYVLLGALAPACSHAYDVLLLYGLDQRVPEYYAVIDAVQREIQAVQIEPTTVYTEFLDESRFGGARDHAILESYLEAKYAGRGVDAVLAVSSEAVAFLAERRSTLFRDAPIVFSALETSPYLTSLPERAYAVVLSFQPEKVVELARQLQPRLDQLVVIEDDADASRARRELMAAELRAMETDLSIEHWSGIPLDELIERSARLPPTAAILYDSATAEGQGEDAVAFVTRLTEEASAPVYSLRAAFMGHGIVGGAFAPLEGVGTEIARRAAAVLSNQQSERITELPPVTMVDARALERWDLDPARLPPDVEQRFVSPSIWKQYQGWIITLLALVGLQFALIVALSIQSISRRRDRLALTEAAHRFRLARIAGQVGFWQWDPTTDRIAVEPELREFLGYDAADSGPIAWRDHVYEKDLPNVLRAARNHLRGRTSYFEVQHRVLDRNKNIRWFLSRGQVLRDRDNQPLRMVGTAIDITDRKRSEDERERAQMQLQEQRVELAHLGRAAAAGALSGALAHELKQPLSAILSNAQAGQKYLSKPNLDREELAAILADIESDGRRAGEVIYHLRNLLHRGDEHGEIVYLHTVVNDVLQLMHSDFVARNVRVVINSISHLPPILADRVQVQQVVLNLLNNAADAMSGTEPRDRRIVISGTATEDRVRLSVADNGCGFGTQNPDRIFKPFVTTKRHGLGLGLSISRSIVESHGGRIWAESNPSGGATLFMELPTTTAEAA